MTESDYLRLCGWKDDPWARHEVMKTMRRPFLTDAAPELLTYQADSQDVFFWEVEEKLFGQINQTQLLITPQAIGDCVSWGETQTDQDTMLIDLLANGGTKDDYPGELATEPTYGGSRCEIGGWWNDYGDGSVGLYAARWTKEYGVLVRKKYGDIDLTTYSGQRAKTYGAKGCPDELEPTAKEHPITAFAIVKSYEEVKASLLAYKPVANASNAGFDMKRGTNGFCRRSTTWNHEMMYRGCCIVKGNQPAAVQKNSWGDYLGSTNNRVQLESGREIILPTGHFLVYPEDVTYAAKQGDTTAKAGINGWQPTKFSWD